MPDTEKILRDVLGEIAREHEYETYELKLQPICTDGASYSSKLYEATISEPGKPDLELFGKVGIIGEEARAVLKIPIYDKEFYFYSHLLNHYKALEEKHKIPEEHRLHIAKYYGCSTAYLQETIVLENLSYKNFTCYDRFKSVEWEFASECIKQLATLHALSVAYGQENPENFEKVLKDLECVYPKVFFEKMMGNAVAVAKEEYRERFTTFLKENMKTETYEKFYKPARLAVLAHGDFRPSNLMYRRLENGQLEVAILDFQTIQSGNPIIDLLYFIFNGSDERFREKSYRQLLEHYYTELCNAMRRYGLDPDQIYSKQDFEYDLKEILPYGLLVVVFTLPLVTIEAENAPSIENDIEIQCCGVKTSALFAERLNGIISDFIKMGLL